MHAVPMRAAGIVLGALGLVRQPALANSTKPICWSPDTAHIACVAILQENPPTPLDRHAAATLRDDQPRRRRAGQGLTARNASMCPVEDAFDSAADLCTGPRRPPDRSRPQLMTDRYSRLLLVADLAELMASPPELGTGLRTGSGTPCAGAPHGLLNQPLGDGVQLDVLALARSGRAGRRPPRRCRPTGYG